MGVLQEKNWNPYVAGVFAGLLLVLSVFFTGKYFGASTTFVRATAAIEQSFVPEKVANMAYFLKNKAKLDWQAMFVLAVLFGSLAAASMGGERRLVAVPPMWEARFGSSRSRRWVTAFLGGVVAMFGARLADG
jgi:hypothetical protein